MMCDINFPTFPSCTSPLVVFLFTQFTHYVIVLFMLQPPDINNSAFAFWLTLTIPILQKLRQMNRTPQKKMKVKILLYDFIHFENLWMTLSATLDENSGFLIPAVMLANSIQLSKESGIPDFYQISALDFALDRCGTHFHETSMVVRMPRCW